jgi:hypothetical protein
LLERAVDEAANAAVLFKVGVDELLGLARLDADLLRESKAERPYTIPKFTALARRRCSGLIMSGGTPKTWDAVSV